MHVSRIAMVEFHIFEKYELKELWKRVSIRTTKCFSEQFSKPLCPTSVREPDQCNKTSNFHQAFKLVAHGILTDGLLISVSRLFVPLI